MNDPIVEEVRKARAEIFKKHGYDHKRLNAWIRSLEKAHLAAHPRVAPKPAPLPAPAAAKAPRAKLDPIMAELRETRARLAEDPEFFARIAAEAGLKKPQPVAYPKPAKKRPAAKSKPARSKAPKTAR